MSDAATGVERLPRDAALMRLTGSFIQALAVCFDVSQPMVRERLIHAVLLASIVSAGAFVRFLGLGSVGLHGDEETMAMAVMGIVNEGAPILPSGMFYPRGLTEIYLMVASVHLFGESEWAFRLPSALCGIALIPLAYMAGRRFLQPNWNLAFAAAVAFLPDFIVYSQTARMYIFLLAAVTVCMLCVFEWERSGRSRWLVGGVIALIVGIELHALAVFSALLFIMPGLLRGDLRKLLLGGAAAVFVFLGYLAIDGFVNAQYPVPPPDYAPDLGPPRWMTGPAAPGLLLGQQLILLGAALGTAFCAFNLARAMPRRKAAVLVGALAFAMLALQQLLFYHVAAIMLLITVVTASRLSERSIAARGWLFIVVAGLFAALQFGTLHAIGVGSFVKVVGAMTGRPSLWPYARVAEFSAVAFFLVLACCTWGVYRFARRRKVADYALLALLTVWIPLFAMGIFLWNVPSRYTAGSAVPLLLCAFAFAQQLLAAIRRRLPEIEARPVQLIATSAVALMIVNPAAVARVINAGYSIHPDHKGAADFIRSQNVVAGDLLLAEDVLQQTYYLDSVDYWLISRANARRFVQRVDGEIRDFYTGTRVVGSGKELEELLDANAGGRIFVIGSGENQVDGRRRMRGFDISEMLESDRFEVLYVGRDGLTKVWRAKPAQSDQPAQTATPELSSPQKSTPAAVPALAEEPLASAASAAQAGTE